MSLGQPQDAASHGEAEAEEEHKHKRRRTSSSDSESLPTIPLLYHLATSAHHAAHLHLQPAFIPQHVRVSTRAPIKGYTPDPDALAKARGFLLMALDMLKIALGLDLTYAERVTFAVDFGVVGLKVLRMGEKTGVQRDKLLEDLQEVLGSALAIAHRAQLKAQTLEVLNVRLAYEQGLTKVAKRMIRQILKDTPRPERVHRSTLQMLLLEMTDDVGEALGVLDELDPELPQLAHIARLRILFAARRWDGIEGALQKPPEDTYFRIQHLLLHALWQGRVGNDNKVRALLKEIYALMDEASDSGFFNQLRANGGVVEISGILVQVTPPNILYMLVFLVTVVTRRDYTGTIATCKSLVHSRALLEFAGVARADDMWDVQFHPAHGPADALALRRQVAMIVAEVKLEEITALAYRDEEDKFPALVEHVRANNLIDELVPPMCFVAAVRAHLQGLDNRATGYYLACKRFLKPGSELGLLVNIGLLGAQGLLKGSSKEVVMGLADQCKGSSSGTISAIGLFLAGLVDENVASAKQQMTAAYDLCRTANYTILRALIFAFTTSTHLTGNEMKVVKQLETGREIAAMMGGEEREGVGQMALGLWFAVKLKKWYRIHGRPELVDIRHSLKLHLDRLNGSNLSFIMH